jgi:hypothetical protein
VLYAAVFFAVISMMIYKIVGATCLSNILVPGRGKIAIQPSIVLTFFTAVACFSGHAHAQEDPAPPAPAIAICLGTQTLPASYLNPDPGSENQFNPYINGKINQAGDGWGENIPGWNGTEYPNSSFAQVYMYEAGAISGDKPLLGRAFVGFNNPYLCVAAYLDYNTHFNNDCTVEESADSSWVNYNINFPGDKLKNSTEGAIFKYVRYDGGTFGRVIGK